jgi:transposase InsO family protein
MPWEDKTVEELRKEFAEAAKGSDNFSALCREFGITRKTGYKWVERYEANEELSDKSKTPFHIANRTPSDIEEMIISMRIDNPAWGAKKIKAILEREGVLMPCTKTVNNILNRYGCITPEESAKHKPFIRYEKDNCNEMWQTDFKGEFLMADKKYCYPLNIFDDCSRFLITTAPGLSTANMVIPTFKKAFYEYGMPESVLSDNGAQFAGFRQGFTQFEKWLMNHNVLPIHGRFKHPQTQGKIERMHRTMKNELLKHTVIENIEDANIKLQMWRDKYNNLRPHEALGMRCPAEVYIPSNRTYNDTVKPYEYGGQYHVIKVNSWGYVRFDNWQIYLSETMINEHIEFRPNPHGDSFIACYRNFKIAEFSSIDGKLLNRKISRL